MSVNNACVETELVRIAVMFKAPKKKSKGGKQWRFGNLRGTRETVEAGGKNRELSSHGEQKGKERGGWQDILFLSRRLGEGCFLTHRGKKKGRDADP